MIKKYAVPHIFLIFIAIFLLPHSSVMAQTSPIRVVDISTVNNFPDALTFNLSVESDSPIVSLKLFFHEQGSVSTNSQPVTFTASKQVSASYTWDTSRVTIPPSAPILYYWQVEDEAGNRLKTPEKSVAYDDIRFNWQEISSPDLTVRWYDGNVAFGQYIFDTGQQALAQMKAQTGMTLDSGIMILLYANNDDFNSWHYFVRDWVGGQAFPAIGVTAQIVPPSTGKDWIQNVIPHEIAHLFFYQTINTHSNDWPSWLDEGLAQYYEFSSNEPSLKNAQKAARNGELIPLVLLSGNFGNDGERVRLAYDESYAAVRYLLEMWGDAGLQALVTSFREGKGYREAVKSALGVTWEEFEAGWLTWLGVPATPASPPTATPTLITLKAPDGWPTPTKVQRTATPATPQPTPTHAPTATRTPVPASASTPTPADKPFSWGTLIGIWCFSLLGLSAIGIGGVVMLRRRLQKYTQQRHKRT